MPEREGRFDFSPLARDVLAVLWERARKAAAQEHRAQFERLADAIEQYTADIVRAYCRRGEWTGNTAKPGR